MMRTPPKRRADQAPSTLEYRKRATHACQRCRATKRRCDDSGWTCRACHVAGVPCVRQTSCGSPQGADTCCQQHVSDSYVQELENRCSNLEAKLRQLEVRAERCAQDYPETGVSFLPLRPRQATPPTSPLAHLSERLLSEDGPGTSTEMLLRFMAMDSDGEEQEPKRRCVDAMSVPMYDRMGTW